MDCRLSQRFRSATAALSANTVICGFLRWPVHYAVPRRCSLDHDLSPIEAYFWLLIVAVMLKANFVVNMDIVA